MLSTEELIKKFDLKAHPEGGYFKEYYRSSEIISRQALPSRFKGDRCFSTSIYFLLSAGVISRLHRIASDEIWHFYMGEPLELLLLFPNGKMEKIALGQDVEAGQTLQYVVSAGCWFGAKPATGSAYSFVGCTVAPGFDFEDFEMADIDALCRQFPELKADLLSFK